MKRGDEYCITERGRKNIQINIEEIRAWGAANQSTIEKFNAKK